MSNPFPRQMNFNISLCGTNVIAFLKNGFHGMFFMAMLSNCSNEIVHC